MVQKACLDELEHVHVGAKHLVLILPGVLEIAHWLGHLFAK